MVYFHNAPASLRLKELAKKPLDLTQEGALTPERIRAMRTDGMGLELLYATERVSHETLEALFSLSLEMGVHDKMVAMQAGEKLNCIHGYPSENRAVLHTAMRDLFEHPQSSPVASQATALARREFEKLKSWIHGVEAAAHFTTMVQVGIGGSDLGPKAIYLALRAFQRPKRHIHFISNVDPDDAAQVVREVDLSKTLFVIVSKSGTTLETNTNEALIRHYLEEEGLDPRKHLIAVTGEGSPMDDPLRYLASFYIWDYVGGRYSVTSMVGGVILAFALGFDLYAQFLKGAHEMDQIALKERGFKNLPLLAALLSIWNRNFLDLPTSAIIPYSQALSRFPAHLQQLEMESNGKRIDQEGNSVSFETGAIIWGEPGTNGQHSFFQLIHQGTTPIPLEIIGFRKSQYGEDLLYQESSSQQKLIANLFAQALALSVGQKSSNPNQLFPGNRPSRILFAEKLDAHTMGAILSFYEHQVAFQGFLWGINSFDQEGVQLGKRLATEFTKQFVHKNKGEPLDIRGFPLGVAFLESI